MMKKCSVVLADEPTGSLDKKNRDIVMRLLHCLLYTSYMGEKTDMNRANEVRPMFRRLADVAERTGMRSALRQLC